MNALRRVLNEFKPFLEEIPFLKPLPERGKYIFAIGGIAWIIGGLIPDTAHFAVTFFSSIGRIVLFVGLLFTLIEGDEDRSIMIISTIISAGALIIIIVELAAFVYFASFESYIYLILFGALAVNSSKYLKRKKWFDEPTEGAHLNVLQIFFHNRWTNQSRRYKLSQYRSHHRHRIRILLRRHRHRTHNRKHRRI